MKNGNLLHVTSKDVTAHSRHITPSAQINRKGPVLVLLLLNCAKMRSNKYHLFTFRFDFDQVP